MKVFFTADTHFFHANIIKYCNRPYSSVEEMNEDLIKRWNAKVGKDDMVYFLGDFGLGPAAKLGEIRRQLNGRITMLRGNHDLFRIKKKKWQEIVGMNDITDMLYWNGYRLYHWPKIEDEDPQWDGYYLCGHIHEKWKWNSRHYNVGVDVNNFEPISFDELEKIIEQREIQTEIYRMGL